MSTMITFAANNDFFRKRKRVYRACESCKKRRKRCVHTFNEQEDHSRLSGDSSTQPAIVHVNKQNDSQHVVRTPSRSNPQSSNDTEDERDLDGPRPTGENGTKQSLPVEPPKFIGFLNPEAILCARGKGPSSVQHQCGYWIPPGGSSSKEGQTNGEVQDHDEGRHSGASAVDRALHAYLEAVGVSLLPPQSQQEALLKIYFSYVHPILPLLDKTSFDACYAEGTVPRVLVQAMCIVAAKHDQARPHLRLGEENNVLEPREFAIRLHTSVTAALGAKLEKDRIVLIQALALISLHFEGSDGAEQASLHLGQAIHHAHTIGLHFGPSKKDASNAFWEDLFWCIWSLDKLFGSMNGRPLLMHDRDNRIGRPERKHTAFSIWLKLSEVMDKVTCLYRPSDVELGPTGWEEAFPSFEEIIDGGERLDGSVVAVLELYYHTVAMASHNARSIHMPVHPTNSYNRQSLSALRVMSIFSSHCSQNLPPLPIVPYSLSLAMSVAYRQFRQSKLQIHRNRAKEDIKTCCRLLNKLRTAWWSAGAMADLGRAALAKADRADKTTIPRQRTTQHSIDQVQKSTDQGGAPRIQPETDQGSVPTQQQIVSRRSSLTDILNADVLPVASSAELLDPATPGQPSTVDLTFLESPDWMNFDAAFENMDTLLGSSGADLSMELLRPFNYEGLDFWDTPPT